MNTFHEPDDTKVESVPVKEISAAIHEILLSDEFKAFINRSRKRPTNNSIRSNLSYYRESFAIEVKVVVDDMIATKKDKEWRFVDYPEIRPTTMYQRISQGFRYLVNEMDTTGEYAKVREMIQVVKAKTGVQLLWLRDRLEGRQFLAKDVEVSERTNVEDDILAFLADDKAKIFQRKGLNLNAQEVRKIKDSFLGMEEQIATSITTTDVRIVKIYMDNEQEKK